MSFRPPPPRRNHRNILALVLGAGVLIGGAKMWAYYKLQIEPHMERMAYLKAHEPTEEPLSEEEQRAEAATVRYLSGEDKRRLLGRATRALDADAGDQRDSTRDSKQ